MFKRSNRLIVTGLFGVTAVVIAGSLGIGATNKADEPQLAHMVYFKLKENTPANRAKLTSACRHCYRAIPGPSILERARSPAI